MLIRPHPTATTLGSFLFILGALANCKFSESKPVPAESTGKPTVDSATTNSEDMSESEEIDTTSTADSSTSLEPSPDDDDAGILPVGPNPSGLALVDSDGNGRVEVVVMHNRTLSPGGHFYVFEQMDSGLKETTYSPVPYLSVDEKLDDPAERARFVALPRPQGDAQDWLGSWSVQLVSSGTLFAAEIFNPTDPQASFLFNEIRLSGEDIPQVAVLDQGHAAAYVTQSGELTVRVRDLQNQWQDPLTYPKHNGWPVDLEASDIDRDGKQDFIIFGNYIGKTDLDQYITVRFGDGNGDFSSSINHNILDLSELFQARLGDVTGDGNLDAILMNQKKLHVMAGFGDGHFDIQHPQTIDFSDDQSWVLSAIEVADFNRDQRSDVALSDCAHDLLHILLANADGQLAVTHSIPTHDCVHNKIASTPSSLSSLDVNGDGNIDLLALGQQTETLRVYFGDGQGLFSVQ